MRLPWRERLIRMESRRRGRQVTARDTEDVIGWETCAIGEQARAHPEVVVINGLPVDSELAYLGTAFTGAVCNKDWREAHTILGQIEDRVLELKREAGA